MQLARIVNRQPPNRVPLGILAEEWAVWVIFALPVIHFALSIVSGDPLSALFAVGVELFALWYLTGLILVTRSLRVLYLNRGNPNQFEIEKTAREALLKLNRLPVYKGMARVPLLSLMAYGEAMQGKYDEAEETYWEVAGSLLDRKQQKSLNYALHIYNLSLTAMKQGRPQDALLLADESLSTFQEHLKNELLGSAYPLNWLGWIWLNEGDLDKSQEYLERAWRILAMPGKLPWWMRPDHVDQLKLGNRVNFSTVILRRGDLEGAQKIFPQIISLITKSFNAMVPSSISEVVALAEEFRKAGDLERAETLLDLCYQYGRSIPDHPDCQSILAGYEALLVDSGRDDDIGCMKNWLLTSEKAEGELND
ncbi:MAG: hypothetical protein AB7W16_18385 [Candidatus Obscuribacterales bacterium]